MASNFEFKNKVKSPAKIKFFSKVASNFSKSEDKLFKTETCSVSVWALYKFIKTKFTSLIVHLKLIFDHHYQFCNYSQQNYMFQYKKLKRPMSFFCCVKRRCCRQNCLAIFVGHHYWSEFPEETISRASLFYFWNILSVLIFFNRLNSFNIIGNKTQIIKGRHCIIT